jgi:hypothetical protein
MSMDCTLFAASPSLIERCAVEPEEFIARLAEQVAESSRLALHKTWHGLHFTLTGKAWEGKQPLAFLVIGGEPIAAEGDEEDEAYSPPRILSPAFVKKLNKALAAITSEEFSKRFDLKRLAREEIYPRIWNESPDALLREYLAAFESVREFIAACAERGDGVVVEMTS